MPENEMNKVSTGKILLSVILIAAGILFLFGNYLNLSIEKLWPLFMMIPVVIFTAIMLGDFKNNYGVIVPAVILTTYTVYFLIMNYSNSMYYGSTWPVFILGPGLGLLALYIANRKSGVLLSSLIIIGVAVIFFAFSYKTPVLIGVCFIAGGCIFLITALTHSFHKN